MMATHVTLHTKVYLAHLDLTGQCYQADFGPMTRQMKPCTTFADGGFSCVKPALISGAAALSLYQDWAADVLDDEISVAQLGSQYAYTETPCPTGTVTAGDVCWMSRGLIGDLNPLSGAIGDMAEAKIGLPYDTAVVQAKVAAAKAAVTVDTNGTAVALTGPTAAQKLYAAVHVFAYSGLTNCVFTVESDNDSGMASATTRITFATVTGVTNEFASVAGDFSTETHHRIVANVTGTGSITFAAAFGVL